eukprot:7051011-Pyramimonas_sp.AAC.1
MRAARRWPKHWEAPAIAAEAGAEKLAIGVALTRNRGQSRGLDTPQNCALSRWPGRAPARRRQKT